MNQNHLLQHRAAHAMAMFANSLSAYPRASGDQDSTAGRTTGNLEPRLRVNER